MIRTIFRETIMAYMADNYRASRMVLSVSGNIDETDVLAEASRQFGDDAETSDLYQERPGSAAGRFKDRPRRGSFPGPIETGEMIMAALIKVTVTATYRGKSYTGEAEVEVERLDQKYMIAHMDLIRDLPAGQLSDCVPLRDRDFDAGTLVWSPEGWCYEPPEFSYDEQHLLRRLANDACRYRDCRGATLDRLRAKGLATWTPTTGRPTVDHCWVSLTKTVFDVADRLLNR